MTSAKSPPSGPTGPAGSRGRQRPAPTIDLKATEIASEPITEPATAGSTPPPAADPPPAASAQPAAEAVAMHAAEEASSRPDPATEAPGAMPQADAAAADAGAKPIFPRISIAWLPPDFPWRLVAAGAAGAVLMLLMLAVAGVFSSGGDSNAQSALETRLARVEGQVRDLAARPTTPRIDPKTVDALTARVAKLETAAATPRPPAPVDPALDNRISMLEGALSALGERVGVVARRTDDIATIGNDARARADAAVAAIAELQKAVRSATPAVAKSDIDALTNRIAALEKTTKALEAAVARRPAGLTDDRSVRLGVTAALLKAAVERGDPFAAELGAARSLAADPKVLAPLDAFATTGVPTAAALARELGELTPKLAQAAGAPPREGGFLDRLQANAEKLVRVRPIDETSGDTPDAIVSRVEARAAQADLANALAELAKLPASARAPAQAWIAKAQARQAAVEASRRFAADALGALGQPSP